MAQINLLKQTSNTGNFWSSGPKIFVRLFLLVLLALVGYYVWLYIDLSSTGNQITSEQNKINADQQAALSIPNRDELFTRQQQVKDLESLIGGHVYWSQFFPELAKVTLKNASYSNMSVSTAGDLTLSATVPTLEDLDKYMQVFDQPEFNKNFYDVRIAGFTKIQSKTSTAVQFSVRMKYNGGIIQYQNPTKTKASN